jgi:thiol-disulfide isomerase/thioredoxin
MNFVATKLRLLALLAVWLACAGAAPAAELLEFSAPWCGPCRDYVPTIEALKAEGYPVRCVNFDTDKAAVQKYGVSDIPEVILLDDSGQPVRRVTGVQPIGTLRQWFAELPPPNVPGPQSEQTPHPSIVRVESPGNGGSSYGSGVLVSADIVVTNWHVVNELVGAPILHFPGQPPLAGQVVKTDRIWDLAAIRVQQSGAQPVHIAKIASRRGEPLTIIGYGSGHYRAVAGYCGTYHAPAGPQGQNLGLPYEFVQVTTGARQGDSGGPVLNARGDLAGVLDASDGQMTVGPCCTRIRRFLFGPQAGPVPATPNTAPNSGGKSVIPDPGDLTPVIPAPSTPSTAPVPPVASVPQDILDRIVALEQKVSGTPGLLAGLQADFKSQLAAIKGNLTDPGKLAALEATVQSVASDQAAAASALAALQNAPGLLGQISTSVQAWIPTLAGGGLAASGLGIPAALGAMGLSWLWKRLKGSTSSPAAAAGATPNAATVPTAALPILTLPNIGAQLAQFNAAISGLTTAANQAMATQAAANQAAASATQINQPDPIVLPQVTNNITKPVLAPTVTNRQRSLEQAVAQMAQSQPGVASTIESWAAQFESGMQGG